MAIAIRPATPDDIPWIVDISAINAKANVSSFTRGFIQSPLPADLIKRWLPNIAVATVDGATAGFAHSAPAPPPSAPRPPEPVSCHIIDNAARISVDGQPLSTLNYEFYGPALVAADYRGQGVYGTLFRYIVATARQQHRQALVAFVDADNPASLAVHTHLGFNVVDDLAIHGRNFHILGYLITENTST